MSHSVHCKGYHNLDISSIEALSFDISNRFDANVIYGYIDSKNFYLSNNVLDSCLDFVILGQITHHSPTKTLKITDEFFDLHILINNLGSKVYELPYFRDDEMSREELEEAIKGVSYDIDDNDSNNFLGSIYNDVFYNFFNYYISGWWTFCTAFIKENKNERLIDSVNTYRKDVMRFFQKIGGNAAVYLDDQGKTQYLTESFHDWKTILNELHSKFNETTLNIPEFMKNKPLSLMDDYPLAFYDDFSDLK
jgi:hypothetical protein